MKALLVKNKGFNNGIKDQTGHIATFSVRSVMKDSILAGSVMSAVAFVARNKINFFHGIYPSGYLFTIITSMTTAAMISAERYMYNTAYGTGNGKEFIEINSLSMPGLPISFLDQISSHRFGIFGKWYVYHELMMTNNSPQ